METAAIRVERHAHGCTVRVGGLVTPALVDDLRRLSADSAPVRCDLRSAALSAEGANALRAWHRAAGGALELLLPEAIAAPAAADGGAGGASRPTPVDLPALLAHEVRGPLSVAHLRLQTQAARMDGRGLPDEAAVARSAMAGLEAVSRLLDTYLTASQPWTLDPVDVSAVAEAAGRDAQEVAAHGTVSVRCQPPGGPVWALGQRQALHQLVWNLVRNGLEAPASEVAVSVDVRRAGGSHVELVITDHGCGFPPEVLQAPFEHRRSGKAGGMGIGLVLCDWIVRRHQGQLQLRNGDTGAQVLVRLPAAPATDA